MAHFAEIDVNGVVKRVLAVRDEDIGSAGYSRQTEDAGVEYLRNICGRATLWVQTSYNNNFRKQFAGAGFIYDAKADVFISPQPYPSWKLDANYDWQAPIPYPDDGQTYYWDETTLQWVVTDTGGYGVEIPQV